MKSLNVKTLWPLTAGVSLPLPNCAPNHRLQVLACEVSATFVVHILKGIQSPPSLPLAWLLTTRSRVMPTASSKIKQISSMGTFLRLKRNAKSFNNTPVSIPSRIKVLVFDSLMRGESKNLFITGEALVLSWWLISFLKGISMVRESLLRFYLGSSCFVTRVVLLLLL